tara:strand:+ start:2047 stop:2520 length:474 start_codon:yes stop_codon:yes gene_type:complete
MWYAIGVEINCHRINVCSLTQDKHLLFKTSFKSSDPLMPGSVVIDISEFILAISSELNVGCVGIAFPGSIDKKRKLIEEYPDYPEWKDVPLGDWLEIRINRKVLISNMNDCKHSALSVQIEKINHDEVFQFAFGAAGLAVDKFSSSKSLPSGSMKKI